MKKRVLSVLLAGIMASALLIGCGSSASTAPAEGAAAEETEAEAPEVNANATGEIKVWVADNVVDFTNQRVSDFMAAYPEYSGFTVTVEPVGEGDAASNMITDVEAGADIFAFAQDQIARLVSAGALEAVAPQNINAVKDENDTGSVAAATVGDTLYAYPLTSDKAISCTMIRVLSRILPIWIRSWLTAKRQERTSTWKSIPAGIRPHSSSAQAVSWSMRPTTAAISPQRMLTTLPTRGWSL